MRRFDTMSISRKPSEGTSNNLSTTHKHFVRDTATATSQVDSACARVLHWLSIATLSLWIVFLCFTQLSASILPALTLGKRSSQETMILSWPSACWAMLALALNTMAQPSGRVLGFPQHFSFVFRSSPLICLIDTIVTLFDIIYGVVEHRSIISGVRLTVRDRFEDVSQSMRAVLKLCARILCFAIYCSCLALFHKPSSCTQRAIFLGRKP